MLAGTLAAFTWLLGGAAAAQAMTLTTGPDPVESVPTQVIVSGNSPGGYDLSVKLKPAGGAACGANRAADTGDEIVDSYEAGGPYFESVNQTLETAGSYLACSWLEDSNGNVIDQTSLVFSVRIPHLSISISAPGTVTPNRIFQIATTAQAETSRDLYEWLIPNTGDGCPANANAAGDTSDSMEVLNASVDGGPSTQSENESFQQTGSWLICAYFQYPATTDPPEATASKVLKVAYPPRPCVVPRIAAGSSLAAAKRSLHRAHCSTGHVRIVYDRFVRRAAVISVSPRRGTRLRSGAPVDVTVSAGPKPHRRHHRK